MEIAPLPQGFGAEVTGLGSVASTSPVDIDRLRTAYDQHHLLIFRAMGLVSGPQQAEIVSWFGPIGVNRDENGNPWTVLDNNEPTGSLILPFHSDICFVEYPLEGLSLHPLALPEVETTTTFISNAAGWDRLPAAVQNHLRHRTVEHRYEAPADMQLDWPVLSHRHQACMEHKRTGRPFAFICENYVTQIDDLSPEESAAMLKLIYDTLYAPDAQYVHRWQLGDLLVWDNLAIQHARTVPSPPSTGRRVMQRVAIGRHDFRDQLARIKAQLAA